MGTPKRAHRAIPNPRMASLLALVLSLPLFSTATPVPQSEADTTTNMPNKPQRYMAFGDSYAAGIGAGSEFGWSHLDSCQRYDGGYPSQLHRAIYGTSITSDNLKACTGAVAADVKLQAEHLGETVELATISVGGNDVGFGDIVKACVYRPWGSWSGNCTETIKSSQAKIDNQLVPALTETFEAFAKRPHHPNLRIFVTGYARFFNDQTTQCSEVSWNYWDLNDPKSGDKDHKMTMLRRKALNDLVDNVNAKIEDVVKTMQKREPNKIPATWTFVNYDHDFETHRFCERFHDEPQKKGEDRLDLWLHQFYTPDGQFRDGVDDVMIPAESVPVWGPGSSEAVANLLAEHPNITVSEPFTEHPAEIDAQGVLRIPSGWLKVFHPTQDGHKKIRDVIWNEFIAPGSFLPDKPTNTTPTPTPDPWKPLDPNIPLGDSGTQVTLNFPRTWQLNDGYKTANEILYRMRDQACQGLCERVEGIPDDLLAHQVHGKDGCEFATKISGTMEMYFHSSHKGQNCYDATERMINDKMTDDGEKRTIYTAAWLNGENENEFYQVGIRPLNSVAPPSHPPLPTDPKHHLGHIQVACKRDHGLVDWYNVYITNWDDGNWGKSILERVKKCRLSPTKWKFEDNDSYTFVDGSKSQKIAKWRMVMSNGGCAEGNIEQALGLRGGGLDCFDNVAGEVDVSR